MHINSLSTLHLRLLPYSKSKFNKLVCLRKTTWKHLMDRWIQVLWLWDVGGSIRTLSRQYHSLHTQTQRHKRGLTQKYEAITKNYGANLLCNTLHAVTPTCLWPSGMFWIQLPAGDSDDVRAGHSRWLTQSRGRGGGVSQYTAPVCSPSPVYTPSAGHLRSCHRGHCLKHSLIGW